MRFLPLSTSPAIRLAILLLALPLSMGALAQDTDNDPENQGLEAEEAGEAAEKDAKQNSSGNSIGSASSERSREIFSYSGTFVPHRRMYIMPLTWLHNPNQSPQTPSRERTRIDEELANEEIKFQLSFKLPILTGLFGEKTQMWFGYTQVSLWQAYNDSESRPFRETNFEPEVFIRHDLALDLGPGTLDYVSVGFNHQSNGRPEPLSRSWNRLIGEVVYSSNRWAFSLRPWVRVPESTADDDNPDIEEFLGYGELNALYQTGRDHTLGLRVYNNVGSGAEKNRTSGEFSWSFPLGGTLRGYIQYYNGYGETLIDYNHRVNRVSFGFLLNDWF